ncbi:hypothetical protein HaLaN_11903 [Haematococcus lacustris]|uniref:Uncharacterized protein n=1 Tax=Haematococcus lacustris TaxID=44745 RepID=A0A699ZIX9_HAELA|nr:hypothetical protein HaLaN_11903 [Haematococcus lacustris]
MRHGGALCPALRARVLFRGHVQCRQVVPHQPADRPGASGERILQTREPSLVEQPCHARVNLTICFHAVCSCAAGSPTMCQHAACTLAAAQHWVTVPCSRPRRKPSASASRLSS